MATNNIPYTSKIYKTWLMYKMLNRKIRWKITTRIWKNRVRFWFVQYICHLLRMFLLSPHVCNVCLFCFFCLVSVLMLRASSEITYINHGISSNWQEKPKINWIPGVLILFFFSNSIGFWLPTKYSLSTTFCTDGFACLNLNHNFWQTILFI